MKQFLIPLCITCESQKLQLSSHNGLNFLNLKVKLGLNFLNLIVKLTIRRSLIKKQRDDLVEKQAVNRNKAKATC